MSDERCYLEHVSRLRTESAAHTARTKETLAVAGGTSLRGSYPPSDHDRQRHPGRWRPACIHACGNGGDAYVTGT